MQNVRFLKKDMKAEVLEKRKRTSEREKRDKRG
jgi:hypothetical protein